MLYFQRVYTIKSRIAADETGCDCIENLPTKPKKFEK